MYIIRVRFGNGALCDYVAKSVDAVQEAAWEHSHGGMFNSTPIGGFEISREQFLADHKGDESCVKDALYAVSSGGPKCKVYALVVSEPQGKED